MKKVKVIFFTCLISILVITIFIVVSVITKVREVYLSDITPNYYSVGYYDLCINEDFEGNKLSLNVSGDEQIFDKGLFAHAHSTIVYDNLLKYNPQKFTTYIGINKTSRNSGTTSVEFLIYFDQELVYRSYELNSNSNAIYIELEMEDVNRITLVIDDLSGNGNDHGVWASPILTYKGGRVLE